MKLKDEDFAMEFLEGDQKGLLLKLTKVPPQYYVSDSPTALQTIDYSVGRAHHFSNKCILVDNFGNSPDKLRHPTSDAYSAQQVLLNKQHIWCGKAYLDWPSSRIC